VSSRPFEAEDAVTTVDPSAVAATMHRTRGASLLRSVRNYIALTKPRVIELLLVTTVPTMILAQGGLPSWPLVALTLLGGSLAAGSANALNCVYDRDIDIVMYRTKSRPIATGEITPRRGLAFGLVLGAMSLTLFVTLINTLSAILALSAILFYVFVYTMGLKRRTAQNIVWGGAAGCIPVLIGWSAVTNTLTWTPLILFGVIFWWTPPHYWPLSMRYRDDYDRAGIPMLSVVATPVQVGRQVVAYSWAMVLWSLLLWPVAGTGLVYLGTAVVAGGGFLVEAHRLLARAKAAEPALAPMRLFHLSITYINLVFLAIAIDPIFHFAVPGF
jgi:protoheme IX farnesyltransferase